MGEVSEPGIHLCVPFLTKYHPVQVSVQIDQVMNIPVHEIEIQYSVVQVQVWWGHSRGYRSSTD